MPTYSGSEAAPLHYDEIFGGASDGEAWPIVVLAGGAARHPSCLGVLAGLGDRHGDPVFDTAIAALKAGPDTDDDAVFNTWQQRTAPAGCAAWGASEQAHARTGGWNLAAERAYFSVDPLPGSAR